MDSSVLLHGRPFGGCTPILFRKSLAGSISTDIPPTKPPKCQWFKGGEKAKKNKQYILLLFFNLNSMNIQGHNAI